MDFVTAYEKMINDYNKRVAATDDKSSLIKEADNEELEQQAKKQNQEEDNSEEQELDLSDLDLSGNEGEDEGQEQVTDQDFSDDETEGQLDDEPQSEYDETNYGEQNQIDLNFSVELATEFSNTVNQFTKICADVVKNRSVAKDTSDKLDKLMGKIKNIIGAAQKSV